MGALAVLWLARTSAGREVTDVLALNLAKAGWWLGGACVLASVAAWLGQADAGEASLAELALARGLERQGPSARSLASLAVGWRALWAPSLLPLALSALTAGSARGALLRLAATGLLAVGTLLFAAALAALAWVAAHAVHRPRAWALALLVVPELLRATWPGVPTLSTVVEALFHTLIQLGAAP